MKLCFLRFAHFKVLFLSRGRNTPLKIHHLRKCKVPWQGGGAVGELLRNAPAQTPPGAAGQCLGLTILQTCLPRLWREELAPRSFCKEKQTAWMLSQARLSLPGQLPHGGRAERGLPFTGPSTLPLLARPAGLLPGKAAEETPDGNGDRRENLHPSCVSLSLGPGTAAECASGSWGHRTAHQEAHRLQGSNPAREAR